MLRIRTALVLALVLIAPLSAAQGETAQQQAAAADEQARALFQEERYEEAAKRFEQAVRLAPIGSVAFNAGLAWDKAGKLARAADAYERALTLGGLEAGREDSANARLATLKQQLAFVWIKRPVGGTVTVAHHAGLSLPARIHLPVGSHTFTLTDSKGETKTVVRELSGGDSITLEVPFDGAKLATQEQPTPDALPASRSPAAGSVEPDAAKGNISPWAWVALGGAGLFTGASIYTGLTALDERDEFVASGRTDEAHLNRGKDFQLLTNIGIGAAVLSAGVGVFLLATSGSGSVSLRVSPTAASARLTF